MATNPRIDFYRIVLRPSKRSTFKTFRNFAEEVLLLPRTASDNQVYAKLLDYFMSKLVTQIANDESAHKQVRWLESTDNLYRDYKPRVETANQIMWGVMTGGRYGRNGLLVDRLNMNEDVDADTINPSKSVLRYFYFMIYLPLDHNEGCLVIHSNSRDESSSDIFRHYLENLFKDRDNYKKMLIVHFCPKYFQNLFKSGAVLKQLQFRDTFIDTELNTNGVVSNEDGNQFEVSVSLKPINKHTSFQNVISFSRNLMTKFGYSFQGNIKCLTDVESSKITVVNPETQKTQTFILDQEDINVCPSIDVSSILSEGDYSDDGTPLIESLHTKVLNIFRQEVLPEIRPDLRYA